MTTSEVKFSKILSSPIGQLVMFSNGNEITGLRGASPDEKSGETCSVLETAAAQIDEYFTGGRTEFVLPLNATGTEFQKRVWAELLKIPYGETRTYKDIAKAAGNEKGSRAVGGACGKNPIMLIVPCHRVVGTSGALTGFAGGIEVKEKLLQLEKVK